jgi:hypothetical protein
MKKQPLAPIVLVLATLAPTTGSLADTSSIQLSGYVKLDSLYARYSDGEPTNELINDFLVPSLIPVGSGDTVERFNLHARESRLRLSTETLVEGHELGAHIELDFMVNPLGDERISNSRAPRLRHAYVTVDNILFGQTWSTFYNVASLPELNDFVGPVGTLFNRQPQIRYTVTTGAGAWDLAIENPETRLSTGAGQSTTFNDNEFPDLVGRYRWNEGDIQASLAGILRRLSYDGNGQSDDALGYGVSAAGRVRFGARDDLRLMINGGNALGRYLGLNAFDDGAIQADGAIDRATQVGGLIGYRHFWTETLRSTLAYSLAQSDTDEQAAGGGAAAAYQSAHVNLLFSPLKALTYGLELAYATRENQNGADGSVTRVQFSAKYGFHAGS